MDDKTKTAKIPCPKCMERVENNIGSWKKHIKEKHKEVKNLRVGSEKIKIK